MRPLGQFVLRGWGKCLPDNVLDNQALGAALGVEPASITSRTGIVERRVAGPGDSASSLAVTAGRQALAAARVDPDDVDLVLLSTYTPDRLLCPTAPKVAHGLGATRAGAFDINGACSGGVTALITATSLINAGVFNNALVTTADLTTLFVRPGDEKTRLVFGDGAAALFVERPGLGSTRPWTLLSSVMGADGSGEGLFCVPSGGSAKPHNGDEDGHYILNHVDYSVSMNGRAIFRFGVEQGAEVVNTLCERAGVAPRDVRWIVPHQANLRIISALIEKSGVPSDRWFVNIQRYGNTASTSVPLALTELLDTGSIAPGDVVLLVAFGAGLTWSGVALSA